MSLIPVIKDRNSYYEIVKDNYNNSDYKKAIDILGNMAIDITEALASLSQKNPLEDVLTQRLEAINIAESLLKKEINKN